MGDWKYVPSHNETTTITAEQVTTRMRKNLEHEVRAAHLNVKHLTEEYDHAYAELWLAAERRQRALVALAAAISTRDLVAGELDG